MVALADLRKKKLAQFAKEEGLLNLKGDINKAGHEIEKFLAPFRKELGKSNPRFLDPTFGADWCAAFVYYLAVKAGYDLDIKPFQNRRGTFGLVGMWFEWSINEGKFKDILYEPEPGDLILYDRLVSDSELDHMGIVLENKDKHCITAEGNVNNMTGIFRTLALNFLFNPALYAPF